MHASAHFSTSFPFHLPFSRPLTDPNVDDPIISSLFMSLISRSVFTCLVRRSPHRSCSSPLGTANNFLPYYRHTTVPLFPLPTPAATQTIRPVVSMRPPSVTISYKQANYFPCVRVHGATSVVRSPLPCSSNNMSA